MMKVVLVYRAVMVGGIFFCVAFASDVAARGLGGTDAQLVENALESGHNLVTGIDSDGKEVHGNCFPHFLSLDESRKDCKMDPSHV